MCLDCGNSSWVNGPNTTDLLAISIQQKERIRSSQKDVQVAILKHVPRNIAINIVPSRAQLCMTKTSAVHVLCALLGQQGRYQGDPPPCPAHLHFSTLGKGKADPCLEATVGARASGLSALSSGMTTLSTSPRHLNTSMCCLVRWSARGSSSSSSFAAGKSPARVQGLSCTVSLSQVMYHTCSSLRC